MKISISQLIPVVETALASKLTPGVILQLLKLYAEYEADAKGGKVTAAQYLKLAIEACAIADAAGIGPADIAKVLTAAQPLVAAQPAQ